jgi:hypothetical protein
VGIVTACNASHLSEASWVLQGARVLGTSDPQVVNALLVLMHHSSVRTSDA